MSWNNTINDLLPIKYPIIQAPMLGVTSPEMVASSLKAGVLGSLALGDLSAEDCRVEISKTKKLTNQPFAVNIFAHQIPEVTVEIREKYARAKQYLENLAFEQHLQVDLPDLDAIKLTKTVDQIDVILEAKCPILSFTFGNLDSSLIDKLKSNGIKLIGTATSVKEALQLEESEIDLICVQGLEAGGHRGSFDLLEIPKIGGVSLLAQVVEQVKKPIIYAGGLYNAQTVLAAKALGAQGFQIGSLLLGCQESRLLPFEKKRLKDISEEDIVLTRSFTGRYARGIKNTLSESLDQQDFILPYPYQNKLTAALRQVAKKSENPEFVSIWAGQSISAYSNQSCENIFKNLIQEIELLQH